MEALGAMQSPVAEKKLSLGSSMMMSIGSIIGAGIFVTTPVAVEMVGPGISWAFILAAVLLTLKMLPQVVVSSAIPANGGNYMHLSRLVHPVVGMVEGFNWILIGTMNIAVMSMAFARYFAALMPTASAQAVAIACCVVFTIIATFGASLSGVVQNVLTAILLVALGLYIFFGLQNITYITVKDVLAPTMQLGVLWAAVGLLNNTLMGGNAVMAFADEIKNPGKTIPIAFFGGTFLVSIIYALIGVVTVGVIPWQEVKSLAGVAEKFFSPALLLFFVTGGALFAIVTTINGMFMMYSRAYSAAAKDGLLPAILAKKNRFNAPYGAIWFLSIVAIVALLIPNLNLRDLIKITAVPGLVLGPIAYLAIFLLPKKYPNCYRNAFLKIPHAVTCTIAVLATVLSLTAGGSVLKSMKPFHWMGMLAFYGAAVLYVVGRVVYMKKHKGVDILANMRKPHAPWQEMESRGTSS
jgi:amino acid transporter